jgi:hypothetical protein
VRRRHVSEGNWQGGAKDLRDQRPVFAIDIGNLHVAMYTYVELTSQSIDLLRSQCPKVLGNTIEPSTSA